MEGPRRTTGLGVPQDPPGAVHSPSTVPRKYWAIKEIAAATGLKTTWLYIQTKTGALPAKKAGTRTIVSDEELTAFLESLPDADEAL